MRLDKMIPLLENWEVTAVNRDERPPRGCVISNCYLAVINDTSRSDVARVWWEQSAVHNVSARQTELVTALLRLYSNK